MNSDGGTMDGMSIRPFLFLAPIPAQLLRGAVRLLGVGGAPRVGGARARRALAPRGGGEEHRGLRRRGPAGAARAPGPLGGADGGCWLNSQNPEPS